MSTLEKAHVGREPRDIRNICRRRGWCSRSETCYSCRATPSRLEPPKVSHLHVPERSLAPEASSAYWLERCPSFQQERCPSFQQDWRRIGATTPFFSTTFRSNHTYATSCSTTYRVDQACDSRATYMRFLSCDTTKLRVRARRSPTDRKR